MSNMSYVRHENTYNDLLDVWEEWVDDNEVKAELNEYEQAARRRLVYLVREMHEQFSRYGTYEFYDSGEDEDE